MFKNNPHPEINVKWEPYPNLKRKQIGSTTLLNILVRGNHAPSPQNDVFFPQP
jgi:hypothetical protein